jgi:phospholipid transport system substrate-binding protein
MLSHRMIATVIGATALLVMSSVQDAWAQAGEQAVTFVKSTSDQLVAIANGADSPQEQRRRLQGVLESTVDIDGIGRFCLGRSWGIATPDQQEEYTTLFHDLLVRKIASHLGRYRGVQVTVGLARTSVDTEIVITKIHRPNRSASQVDWVVGTDTGGPKIVDLLSEGTSLRLAQSEEFHAFLARRQYNVDALVQALRQNIAQNR